MSLVWQSRSSGPQNARPRNLQIELKRRSTMTTRRRITVVTTLAAVLACAMLNEERAGAQSTAPAAGKGDPVKTVYLSDLSRTGFPCPHPKRLVDAKRRTFSFALPLEVSPTEADRPLSERPA